MISIVNGYVCRSCCDVSVAKKGHDPRNPTENPVKAEQLAIRDGKAPDVGRSRTVSFRNDQSTAAGAVLDAKAPFVGALLDVFA